MEKIFIFILHTYLFIETGVSSIYIKLIFTFYETELDLTSIEMCKAQIIQISYH